MISRYITNSNIGINMKSMKVMMCNTVKHTHITHTNIEKLICDTDKVQMRRYLNLSSGGSRNISLSVTTRPLSSLVLLSVMSYLGREGGGTGGRKGKKGRGEGEREKGEGKEEERSGD